MKNKILIILFVAIFAGIGTYLLINSRAAVSPSDTAKIWVDADGGNCIYSSSPQLYSTSNACASLNAACTKILNSAPPAANTTLVVPVKGGTYNESGSETSLSNCKPVGKLVFQVVSGEKATTSDTSATNTSNVTIEGFYVNMANNGDSTGAFFECSTNVTLKNIEFEGDHSATTTLHSAYGDAIQVWPKTDKSCNNQNITLDGLFIHDLHTYVATVPDPHEVGEKCDHPANDPNSCIIDNHTDCIQAGGANGLNILNSRMVNCGTQSLQLNDDAWPCGCGDLRNVVMENNMIGMGGTVGGMTGFKARNNVFRYAPNFNADYIKGAKEFTGNIFQFSWGSCYQVYAQGVSSSVVFKYNIANFDCNNAVTNSKTVANLDTLFVNPSTNDSKTWDYHLKPGTNDAVGSMPFNLAPTTDIDGDARPQSGNVDIGPDQRTSSTTPTPPTPPPTPPASTTCPNKDAGQCRPYDDKSAWNTKIPANAVEDAQSATFVGFLKTIPNNPTLTSDVTQYTVPVYLVDSSSANTGKVKVYIDSYFGTYDQNDGSRVGLNGAAFVDNVPIPTNAVSGAGSDGQITFWDPKTGVEYGFWQFYKANDGTYHATSGFRTHTTAGFYGRFSDGLAGRGAGTTYFSGLVRRWEIDQGKIEHALSFAYTSPCCGDQSTINPKSWRYPAGKSDGAGNSLNSAVEGALYQIKPNISDDTIKNTWGCVKACFTIAKALQEYGMYAIDNSGSSKIYLEDNSTAGWTSAPANSDAKYIGDNGRNVPSAIPWDAFRVVNSPCDLTKSTCANGVELSNSTKSGDTDNDSDVDATDLNNLLSNYKSKTYTSADFNSDGIVNARDLSILLKNYGQ